jgi:hypothetical protein
MIVSGRRTQPLAVTPKSTQATSLAAKSSNTNTITNNTAGLTKARFTDGFETKTQTFPPVPSEWKYPEGGYKTSLRDQQGLLERGFKEGGFAQGVAWLQEVNGLKVDGKFGKGTYEAIKDDPSLIKMLRDQRLAETPNANGLKKMSPANVEALKNELTSIRDKASDTQVGVENAVAKLQEYMVRSGEPMVIDGKLGKDTYDSMKRLYGKETADQLSGHLQMLKTTEGDM